MAYNDLRDFIEILESNGMLKRIKEEVDPELEISEIIDRVSNSNGQALLFENPKGYDIPIAANLFGSLKRMQLALETSSFENIGKGIVGSVKPKIPSGIVGKVKSISKLKEIRGAKVSMSRPRSST